MSKAMKPVLQPSSVAVLPVGEITSATSLTLRAIMQTMGLCNASGVPVGAVDSYRFVGLEARAVENITNPGNQSYVKFKGGATYQLSDKSRYARMRVGDKNPTGFWRDGTVPDESVVDFNNVDIGSVTIAIRFRNASFRPEEIIVFGVNVQSISGIGPRDMHEGDFIEWEMLLPHTQYFFYKGVLSDRIFLVPWIRVGVKNFTMPSKMKILYPHQELTYMYRADDGTLRFDSLNEPQAEAAFSDCRIATLDSSTTLQPTGLVARNLSAKEPQEWAISTLEEIAAYFDI